MKRSQQKLQLDSFTRVLKMKLSPLAREALVLVAPQRPVIEMPLKSWNDLRRGLFLQLRQFLKGAGIRELSTDITPNGRNNIFLIIKGRSVWCITAHSSDKEYYYLPYVVENDDILSFTKGL